MDDGTLIAVVAIIATSFASVFFAHIISNGNRKNTKYMTFLEKEIQGMNLAYSIMTKCQRRITIITNALINAVSVRRASEEHSYKFDASDFGMKAPEQIKEEINKRESDIQKSMEIEADLHFFLDKELSDIYDEFQKTHLKICTYLGPITKKYYVTGEIEMDELVNAMTGCTLNISELNTLLEKYKRKAEQIKLVD